MDVYYHSKQSVRATAWFKLWHLAILGPLLSRNTYRSPDSSLCHDDGVHLGPPQRRSKPLLDPSLARGSCAPPRPAFSVESSRALGASSDEAQHQHPTASMNDMSGARQQSSPTALRGSSHELHRSPTSRSHGDAEQEDEHWSGEEESTAGDQDGHEGSGKRKRPMSVSCELCKTRKVKCERAPCAWVGVEAERNRR